MSEQDAAGKGLSLGSFEVTRFDYVLWFQSVLWRRNRPARAQSFCPSIIYTFVEPLDENLLLYLARVKR